MTRWFGHRPLWLVVGVSLMGAAVACAPASVPGPPRSLTATPVECRFLMPDSAHIYQEAELDAPLQPTAFGPQRYPREMRGQFISGRVVVHFVVDANGAVVGPSIAVDSASRPEFIPSAIDLLVGTRYRPGAILGKPVPVCVQQTINWQVS